MVRRQVDGRLTLSLVNSSNGITFTIMKFRFISFALALSFSTLLSAQRYGVVDMDYILQNTPEYAQSKSQLDKLSEQWAGEVSSLQSELQSLKDALAAERILLSPDKLTQREKSIEDKQMEVISLQQKYLGPAGQLFEKRAQLVQPIQDKIFGAVQAVARKRKLELVLDKSAQSGVLYVEKEKDYSDEVLNSLKK